MVAAFEAVGEILQVKRDIALLQIAAMAQLSDNVRGDVFGSPLGGVESDDADRIAVLTGKQVLDHRLEAAGLVVRLAPGAADFTEIVGDQIDGMVVIVGRDRGRPVRPTYKATPRNQNRDSIGARQIRSGTFF